MPHMDDDLLPIGRFARLTGLTIGALRHYDEAGVLEPADVDPATGYRRYRRDQVATARAVAALRDLELSLPAIRALLDADDPATRGGILRDERTRLEARTARLQRALHRLNMLAAANPTPDPHTKEVPVPTPPKPPELSPEIHRALGVGLYNRCWDLMENEDRTRDQDDELIATAFASAWHWLQVGQHGQPRAQPLDVLPGLLGHRPRRARAVPRPTLRRDRRGRRRGPQGLGHGGRLRGDDPRPRR